MFIVRDKSSVTTRGAASSEFTARLPIHKRNVVTLAHVETAWFIESPGTAPSLRVAQPHITNRARLAGARVVPAWIKSKRAEIGGFLNMREISGFKLTCLVSQIKRWPIALTGRLRRRKTIRSGAGSGFAI